ncbi:uncharacterized protein LOC109806241, partial [Cajanus cajan]|uniref:uncharacterized protein LOC109806241 n=1 Tax=Cajanus cajan TaxID=3821 RepID=UPI0010FB9685
MHKFKFLATQCAVAGSPTRSPTTSPVIHLRRRKTLRMFLARRRFHPPPKEPPPIPHSESRVRHKLKDLFVSSPPPREGPHEVLPNSSVAVRFRRSADP